MEQRFFTDLTKPVTFIIMRHGESVGNAAGILQGRGEYDLSEKGREQALEKAELLRAALLGGAEADAGGNPLRGGGISRAARGGRSANADSSVGTDERPAGEAAPAAGKSGPSGGAAIPAITVVCSPQSRAAHTAEIVAKTCGLAAPRHIIELQEMHLGEWSGKTWEYVSADAAYADFRSKSWDAVPGAETSAELFSRARAAWEKLRDTAAATGSDVIIAVSHGGIIQWLIKTTLECRTWFPLFPIHNCGLFIFRAESSGSGADYTAWDYINA